MKYFKELKGSGDIELFDKELVFVNELTVSVESAEPSGTVAVATKSCGGQEWHGSHEIGLSGDRTQVIIGVYQGLKFSPSFSGDYKVFVCG